MIDFTPELRKEALAVLEKYNYGPLYTPPSLQKPTIEMPGIAGGASWAGAAFDPETGILYVPSITLPLCGHAGEVAGPACRLCRDARSGGDDGRHPALETALRPDHRHRSEHGRSPVDGADGRPRPEQSRVETARPPAARASRARSRAPDENAADRRARGHDPARERRPAQGSADAGRESAELRGPRARRFAPTTRPPARSSGKWRCHATRRARR